MKSLMLAIVAVAIVAGCKPSPEYLHQLDAESKVWEAEKSGTQDDVRRAAEDAARIKRSYGNYEAARMFEDIARDARR